MLDVVRAEEQRHFARRYKDTSGDRLRRDWRGAPRSIASKTHGSWPIKGLRPALGAMSFSHTLTFACSFVSPRAQMRSTSTLIPFRGLRRLVDALDTRPRGPIEILDSPAPLSKGGHLALGCLRRSDLGKIDRRLHRVVHEIRQQELRSQRDHLDDVGVRPPGVLLGVGHPGARFDEGLRERHRSLP